VRDAIEIKYNTQTLKDTYNEIEYSHSWYSDWSIFAMYKLNIGV